MFLGLNFNRQTIEKTLSILTKVEGKENEWMQPRSLQGCVFVL